MLLHASQLRRTSFVAILVFLCTGLAACATTERAPTSALQSAEQAIADAEQARALEHSPLEFREAREKLDAARTAVQEEDMEAAAMLAEEAEVLAELAAARSEMQFARKTNRELKRTTEMFKEELGRQQMGETS